MPSWAAEELKYANLPDKRLNKRLITIVKNLASQPSASIPQASGDWANTKATYNFWDSERIEYEDIIDAHRRKTAERASSEKVILAIQDTGDIYELFALEREANSELLIRAKHNRCIEDELKYLQAGSAKIPSSGTVEVLIPKQEGKPARTARLTIRYSSFTILPPKSYRSYRQAQAITLNVVFALEENPPASVKAIDWLLLTTLWPGDYSGLHIRAENTLTFFAIPFWNLMNGSLYTVIFMLVLFHL
jgi:hypothetical protein